MPLLGVGAREPEIRAFAEAGCKWGRLPPDREVTRPSVAASGPEESSIGRTRVPIKKKATLPAARGILAVE